MAIRDKIILGFFVVLVGAAIYLWLAPSGLKEAPAIKFTYLDGKSVELSALRGRPVLVTFWSTTCVTCIEEMPHLVELYNALNGQGLEIIGVAMPGDRPDHVNTMKQRKGLPYPIALDVDGEVVAAFGNVRLTPTTFLISPDGRIIKHQIGKMDMKSLHVQIENLMQSINKAS